ncbi:rho-gdp dissociation inhibitor [Coccidioides immitis RMSCC 3703]|uniref:Rho-gdp dissociation inhibitor n=1 Tax=Coccidioides immitis RMSCC 3703 TaxID=454286 RepID=A0A0J8R0Q8_COCIT|nr:rho-gdp dissociation inhibitor [Coccidioides immitis RMSCC 3703]
MADHEHDDDLNPTKTEGFKVGEKKTVEEYQKLDANDESLNRWKASLGLGSGTANLRPQRPPQMHHQISRFGGRRQTRYHSRPLRTWVSGEAKGQAVHHQGKLQIPNEGDVRCVKRKGVRVSKDQEMLGSYAPNTTDKPVYEKKFNEEQAPSGMLARGHYTALSRFVDDDDTTHLQFEWSFDFAKDW